MLVYIAFRFEWIYGVAAVVAVFHDTIITIGLFSLFNKPISLTVVAALLTLVGYSMNDTIVVFDRIRENLKMSRRDSLANIINLSINQTLSRTVLTSGLTLLTALALWLFGGDVLNGFSFALVMGIIVGTYLSPVRFWYSGRTSVARGNLPRPCRWLGKRPPHARLYEASAVAAVVWEIGDWDVRSDFRRWSREDKQKLDSDAVLHRPDRDHRGIGHSPFDFYRRASESDAGEHAASAGPAAASSTAASAHSRQSH
jgi:hypothetical protein